MGCAGIRGITAREDSCTPPAFLILKLHFLHPFWTLNDFKQRSKIYFSLDQGDCIHYSTLVLAEASQIVVMCYHVSTHVIRRD